MTHDGCTKPNCSWCAAFRTLVAVERRTLQYAAEDRGVGKHNCGFCGAVVSIDKRCHTCESICAKNRTPSLQMREYEDALSTS